MLEKFLIPVYMPRWLYDSATRLKRTVAPPKVREGLDLSGDRDIEWSFIAARIPKGPGAALDFGCYSGNLCVLAAQHGFQVLGIDLETHQFPYHHPNVEFRCGDLIHMELPTEKFDLILNCSTIEHVGLPGRYGVTSEQGDGDLRAMRKLLSLMKSSGRMLLTLPCGQDATFIPWHRVYGHERLPRLLEGYEIEEQRFWMKEPDNRWKECDPEKALSFAPTGHSTVAVYCSYALGCFVLRKKATAPANGASDGG